MTNIIGRAPERRSPVREKSDSNIESDKKKPPLRLFSREDILPPDDTDPVQVLVETSCASQNSSAQSAATAPTDDGIEIINVPAQLQPAIIPQRRLYRKTTQGRSEENALYSSMINKRHFSDCYRNEKRLQKGSYGVVYEASRVIANDNDNAADQSKLDGDEKQEEYNDIPTIYRKYAVKVIDRLKLKQIDDHAVFREVRILQELADVPHVINLVDFFVEPKTLYVVQNLAAGGDVFDYLLQRKDQHFTEAMARNLAHTLLLTLAELHKRKIVHRDLKPGNLLLAHQPQRRKSTGILDDNDCCSNVLLADFGFATHLDAEGYCRTRCGTPMYVAPEIILDTPYTTAVDMWSCGCILYMLLCGYLPFQGDNTKAVFRKARAANFTFHFDSWENVSIPAKQLIVHLLTVNPKHRWTAEEALESPWIKNRMPDGTELSKNDLSGALGRIRARRKLKAAMDVVRLAATQQFWNPEKVAFSQHLKAWGKIGGSKGSINAYDDSADDSGSSSESSSVATAPVNATITDTTPPPSPGTPIKTNTFEERYTLLRKVQKGVYASVWECRDQTTQEIYAVKIIPRPALSTSHDEQVLNEVSILQVVSAGNPECIVRMVEFYEEEDAFFIVMELMNGGDVFDRVAQRPHYSEGDARKLIKRLLQAVKVLHDQGIAHRDIKPQNLLLQSQDNDFDIKLCDFGFAQRVHTPESLTQCIGSPPYVAPEILKNIPHDERVDLWSVGITSFVLLVGYSPFTQDSREMVCQQIKAGNWSFYRPDWKGISPDAKDLIEGLLQVDPIERMSAAEALQSPWILQSENDLSVRDLTESLIRLKTRRKDLRSRALTWITNKAGKLMHKQGFAGKPIDAPTQVNEIVQPEGSTRDRI